MVKAREFVRQAKSSFVYGEVGGFLLPSWIQKGNDHREQTTNLLCDNAAHGKPTQSHFNQFAALLYMHQLFWQANVVLGNERGGGAMDLYYLFRCLTLLYSTFFHDPGFSQLSKMFKNHAQIYIFVVLYEYKSPRPVSHCSHTPQHLYHILLYYNVIPPICGN